jgi:hypothetical protein
MEITDAAFWKDALAFGVEKIRSNIAAVGSPIGNGGEEP